MNDAESTTIKQSKAPLYISIGIIAGMVGSYFFIPGVHDFVNNAWDVLTSENQKRVEEWVRQFGFWGPLVIVLVMILQMFLLVIPSPLLMIVTILAYGPVLGSAIILASIACASSVGYAIGAYFGPPVVEKILGEKGEKKIESFIDDYGFWTVIVTRLSPFLSNDAISFVAGMLRMGYWRFIGATLLGITPLTLFMAYLGEEIDRLKTGLIWGSVICMIGFGLFVWWDRSRKNKKPNASS